MNTFEAISQRRSIRRFKNETISDEIIIKILRAYPKTSAKRKVIKAQAK